MIYACPAEKRNVKKYYNVPLNDNIDIVRRRGQSFCSEVTEVVQQKLKINEGSS
jgi:hypothetical protein